MKRSRRDPVREDRIHNEAIVDARPEEQAMSWYYYLESKISFPVKGKQAISSYKKRCRRPRRTRGTDGVLL